MSFSCNVYHFNSLSCWCRSDVIKAKYCEFCGRQIKDDACICINSNRNSLSQKETIVLTVVTMTIPVLVFNLMLTLYSVTIDTGFLLQIGSGSILLILAFYLIFEKVNKIKVSLIAILFNCHQRKDRSIYIRGKAMAICGRCFGIILGVILVFFTADYFIPSALPLMSIPLILDGLIQKHTIYRSNTIKRLISGILFAFPMSYLYSLCYYFPYYIMTNVIKLIL